MFKFRSVICCSIRNIRRLNDDHYDDENTLCWLRLLYFQFLSLCLRWANHLDKWQFSHTDAHIAELIIYYKILFADMLIKIYTLLYINTSLYGRSKATFIPLVAKIFIEYCRMCVWTDRSFICKYCIFGAIRIVDLTSF